ncbi:MAG: hypothetical protein Kow0069_33110 [Promethearchaeota archaeon]
MGTRRGWNKAALAALAASLACGERAAASHGGGGGCGPVYLSVASPRPGEAVGLLAATEGGRVEGISALGTARPFEALLKK